MNLDIIFFITFIYLLSYLLWCMYVRVCVYVPHSTPVEVGQLAGVG